MTSGPSVRPGLRLPPVTARKGPCQSLIMFCTNRQLLTASCKQFSKEQTETDALRD